MSGFLPNLSQSPSTSTPPIFNEASFLSKATRFPILYKNTGPGPGAYHKSFSSMNPALLEKSRAKTRLSPAFYKRNSRNRFTKLAENPGPGVYEPKNKGKHVPTARFVFESAVKRLESFEKAGPGPGVYEIKRGFAEKRPHKSSKICEKQVSQELWERNIIERVKEWSAENAKIEGKAFKRRGKLRRFSAKNGKGSQLARKLCGNDENKHVLAEFLRKSEGNQAAPGPGSYFQMRSVEKQAVTAAVFKSESQRNATNPEFMGNIGPGSYGPQPLRKKKDFHYNGYGKWV